MPPVVQWKDLNFDNRSEHEGVKTQLDDVRSINLSLSSSQDPFKEVSGSLTVLPQLARRPFKLCVEKGEANAWSRL